MKILIVCPKHTGSNLFCSPAIRLIKDQIPNSRVEVIALNKLSAEVFLGNSDIDALHITTSPRVVRRLSEDSDIALCLNPKSKDLLKHAGCPVHVVPTFLNDYHQADAILEFVAATLGLDVDPKYRRYVIARGELPEPIAKQPSKLIGLHLGCGKTAKHGWKFFHSGRGSHQKLWPLERYIELGRLILELYPQHRLVITGTRNEAFLAKQFVKALPATISLIGQTSARSLAATIEQMDAFVSHDCGVLHIASATDTPIISMFGSTFPEETGPYPAEPTKVVLAATSMDAITPKSVLQILQKLLTSADADTNISIESA